MSKAYRPYGSKLLNYNYINVHPTNWYYDGVTNRHIGLNNFISFTDGYPAGAGWYRLFKLSTRQCVEGSTLLLSLQSYYNSSNNASYLLAITCSFQRASITVLSRTVNQNIFSDVRIVRTSDQSVFIEVYYTQSGNNNTYATVLGCCSALQSYDWLASSGSDISATLCTCSTAKSIQRRTQLIACNQFAGSVETVYSSGSLVPFTKEMYNDTCGKVRFFADGIIDIYSLPSDAKVMISCTVWCWTNGLGDRPWLQIVNRKTGNVIATAISSSYQNYHTFTISDAVVPFDGFDSDGTMRMHACIISTANGHCIDRGIGITCSSFTVKLLNVEDTVFK